jgi:hypothetical protein
MPDQAEKVVEDALRKEGLIEDEEVEAGPSYRMVGTSAIPVPKHLGKIWQSRRDQACASRQDVEECWAEAIRYYENDQSSHRDGRAGRAGNSRYARRLGDEWSATENVVFSNVSTMLPMLYAKNPNVEITATNEEVNADFAKCCEALIDRIFYMNAAPGINLKPKARRGVFYALLMNAVYTKVGYTKKADSSEQVLEDLRQLSEEYSKAKTAKQTKEIEGKLAALEEKVELLSPSGPSLSIVSAFRIFIDPSSKEPDHSDANWIMEYDMLPTVYLNAMYRKKQGEKMVSVYEPTHVVRMGETANVDDEVNSFSLFNKDPDQEAKNYGYPSKRAFDVASYTKVWYIWDKTTRRVFMYADNDWTWPIWVWDDPLGLLEFYPYDQLHFHEGFEGSQSKGEVTYYLDQQDTINDNLSVIRTARNWAKNNVFFDKNTVSQHDVEQVLSGPDGTARGLDIPEGRTLKDVIQSMPHPALAYPELLDNKSSFEAINRITGISEAQRGGQFKTNTTNEAIDFYKANVDIRVDEKIDLIEDWIGKFAWKLLQLLAKHMTVEEVTSIVGPALGQHWKQITDVNELRVALNLRIVGGSTDKPTSKVKKEQALKIAQILGQFANAIPALGMLAVQVIERAFDEIVLSPADWERVEQSMVAQQQKAGAGPQGAEGAPQEGGEPAQGQLAELIKQLPPEAQQKLSQLVESGVPPTQALQQVAQELQQQPKPN